MSADDCLAAYEAIKPWLDGTDREEGLKDFLGDLLCLCEAYHISPSDLHGLIDQTVEETDFVYEGDLFEVGHYDGWERIHDDNKAEGRPVGRQWSKEGVYYKNGHKMYAQRAR